MVAQELRILDGEVVFEKRPPNAFEMTDLADNLRSRGATSVVVTGMETQYCVDSTCHGARDLSYDAVLVADGHTYSDTPVMNDKDIVSCLNATLYGPFCHLVRAEEWSF